MNNEIDTAQQAILKAQKELFFAENRAWEQAEEDINEALQITEDLIKRFNLKE